MASLRSDQDHIDFFKWKTIGKRNRSLRVLLSLPILLANLLIPNKIILNTGSSFSVLLVYPLNPYLINDHFINLFLYLSISSSETLLSFFRDVSEISSFVPITL